MFNPALYHPKWSLIRRMVLRRAAHRCEWCGARQRRPHPRTGSRIYLAVAHLDRDRAHNRFWNLAALCQACHLAHDRPQHLVSRRAGRDWLGSKTHTQLLLDLPAGPVLAAYRAGLVQLVPLVRQQVRQQVAAGKLTPRTQLRLTYQPLMAVSVQPLSPAEARRRQQAILQSISQAAAAPAAPAHQALA